MRIVAATTDEEMLHTIIGAQILGGTMDYRGFSNMKGFEQFRAACRTGDVQYSNLDYGFVEQTENLMLPDCAKEPQFEKAYRLLNLSDHEFNHQTLNELEKGLEAELTRPQLASASAPLLEKIGELMDEAIAAAGVSPDRVFVTGGSARSPLIKAFIRQKLPAVPLEGGDDFGSVASGLARYAERLFAG